MASAKVTSKGQVTIPIEVRNELGITTGMRLDFIPNGDGSYRVVPKKRSIMDLIGLLGNSGQPVAIETMDQGIADAVSADYLRSVGGER
jgi:AbrB family looped-hinge helix DNA binding protein